MSFLESNDLNIKSLMFKKVHYVSSFSNAKWA